MARGGGGGRQTKVMDGAPPCTVCVAGRVSHIMGVSVLGGMQIGSSTHELSGCCILLGIRCLPSAGSGSGHWESKGREEALHGPWRLVSGEAGDLIIMVVLGETDEERGC
jgi:hypothetical protein